MEMSAPRNAFLLPMERNVSRYVIVPKKNATLLMDVFSAI